VDILEDRVSAPALEAEELVFPILLVHKQEMIQESQLVEMEREVAQPVELSRPHTLELLSQGLHILLDLITARVQTERMVAAIALTILVLLEQA
jgi:hypothetical protein